MHLPQVFQNLKTTGMCFGWRWGDTFDNRVHVSNPHHPCHEDSDRTMPIESAPVLGIFSGLSWLILLFCEEIARTSAVTVCADVHLPEMSPKT